MSEKIKVQNIYKMFGPHPKKAMKLLKEGLDKQTIHKRTGMTVGVQDASFTINKCEIFVIMGLSGSGKSTMVRMLNRLIAPTAGHIYVDGQDVATMGDADLLALRRRKMSMVFQSFALMPHLSVLDNATFGRWLESIRRFDRSVPCRRWSRSAWRAITTAAPDSSPAACSSGGPGQRVDCKPRGAVDG